MLGIAFSGVNTFYLIIILLTLIKTINTKTLEQTIRKLVVPKAFYAFLIIIPILYIYGYMPKPSLINRIGYINLHLIYLFGVFLSLYKLSKQ